MAWQTVAGTAESVELASSQAGAVGFRSEPPFSRSEGSSAPPAKTPDRIARTMAANEFLFMPGDLRTHVFRVESGAICLYQSRRADRKSVIEFVFPGDFAGFGFLDKHILSARALLETTVTCVPVDSIDDIIRDNPRAQAKLALAIDREFEAHREDLSSSGQRQPIERVAALLVTSSRTNIQQGRDPHLIKDSWRCGVIADLLRLSLDDLTKILVELERRDLIEATADGLRLTDIVALEALADGLRPGISRSGASMQPRSPRPPKPVPNYKAA